MLVLETVSCHMSAVRTDVRHARVGCDGVAMITLHAALAGTKANSQIFYLMAIKL